MTGTMKVSTRLALAFGVVLALMLGSAGIALSSLATFNRQVETLVNNKVQQIIVAGNWQLELLESARHMRNVFLVSDKDAVKEDLQEIRKERESCTQMMEQLQKLAVTEKQRAMFRGIAEARQKYVPEEDDFLAAAEAGNLDNAKKVVLERARPTQLEYIKQLDVYIDQIEAETKEAAKEAHSVYTSSFGTIAFVAVAALILAAAVATVISRGLRRQLGGEPSYAAEIATRIARGDLTAEVHVQRGDTTSLIYSMEQMVLNLRKLVAQVADGAATVSDTSEQIAQGNTDLSQRTEEQASTLEETASQMEELTSTVTQNAGNAREASQLAVGASEVARQGGEVVGQVVATMTGISESSRKISDIIGVIDGIAFQTNILALNAAVEAARAGDQGRGFAVVAAEVRNLAQRSAAAAKEIKALISASVDQVENGTRLVDAAGRTMGDIVVSVKKVSDLIAEIASASQEQSAGIEQVNTAVSQMDQVVQQNASLVEEATAATESMKQQARALLNSVSAFDIGARAARAVETASPRGVQHALPASIQPIKVRPSESAPAHAAVLPAGETPGWADRSSWREF